MPNALEPLLDWLERLEGSQMADWPMLPDIGLYMDQVQTYIDRQLVLYSKDEQDRLLTAAMINNYIKDDLIPRAEGKKYYPVHLALLMIIATLKPVLSMQDLNRLLDGCRAPGDAARLYPYFLQVHDHCLQTSTSEVRDNLSRLQAQDLSGQEQRTALRKLALELSVEARLRVLVVEKLLGVLDRLAAADEKAEPAAEGKRKK
ncbi:MAG: DUF1836 domain-containing protein [Clostridiaceae bacterium]|nr:DUF1836 domain-containing protein [Clostridiaceae bacterium]